MTPNDAFEFFVELVSQLFHAGVLITDQAERIEALQAESARLSSAGRDWRGGRVSGHPPNNIEPVQAASPAGGRVDPGTSQTPGLR